MTSCRVLASAALLTISVSKVQAAMSVAGEERLSTLLERAGASDAATGSVQWLRESRLEAQRARKGALLQILKANAALKPRSDLLPFVNWFALQPVTGSEWLPESSVARLKADPALDPLLASGDRVRLHKPAQSIAVVTGRGEPCSLAYRPEATLRDYVETCAPGLLSEKAYLTNPGEQTESIGVAAWNADNARVVLPGAWIVTGMPVSTDIERDLAEQLATLGPWQGRSDNPVSHRFEPEKALPVSSSDYGSVGLLQLPTARFREVGSVAGTFNRVSPYQRYNITLQPLSWLEGGFRYTDIRNRPYGPESLSGDQTYKDKSIDVKFKLANESRTMPAVALGLRDVGGTSFFSSEYLVGSKRWHDWDVTLGMAWGNLASRGHFRNPFDSLLPGDYNTRVNNTTPGATNNSYFKGPMSVIGGVEWHFPSRKASLKLEYDANGYQQEPLNNQFSVKAPINAGVVYRLLPNLDLQAGIERGDTLSISATWHGNLSRLSEPKREPTALPVNASKAQGIPDWNRVANLVQQQANAEVLEINQDGSSVQVTLGNINSAYPATRLERAGRVLSANLPDAVRWFDFKIKQFDLPVAQFSINRDNLVKRATSWQPERERPPLFTAASPSHELGIESPVLTRTPSRYAYRLNLDYNQTLGGPNAFLLYQVDGVATGRYNLTNNTWLFGSTRLRLLDNYNDFTFDAPSGLPRVRTDIRRYITSSPVQMTSLQLTHAQPLSDDWFVMAYGGYLERIFAGVGGELLWRKQGSPVAVGVDINRVQQRDFDGGFGTRDYRVNTGHLSIYADTGIEDIQATVRVGRYLAGDYGVTTDLSRVFRNGVVMGAYATVTDASRAEFGEGSFTKGLYVNIPFDALLPGNTKSMATFNWTPLTRDGGALLARPYSLHGLLDLRSPRTLGFLPAEVVR